MCLQWPAIPANTTTDGARKLPGPKNGKNVFVSEEDHSTCKEIFKKVTSEEDIINVSAKKLLLPLLYIHYLPKKFKICLLIGMLKHFYSHLVS